MATILLCSLLSNGYSKRIETPEVSLQAKADSVFAVIFGMQEKYTLAAREVNTRLRFEPTIARQIDSLFMCDLHKKAQDSIRALGLVNPGSGTTPDTLIWLYGRNENSPADTNLGGWLYNPRHLFLKPNSATPTNVLGRWAGKK
ncbi:MAG: hypothetical protein WCV85_04180 [Patescibacteria group bacterium]|jgi:hypothetical protein